MKKRWIMGLVLAALFLFAGRAVGYAATCGSYIYEVLDNGTAEITDFTGTASVLEIPATLDGYVVTSIGDRAFYHCWSMNKVLLPEGITSIGYGAFSHCEDLRSIRLPNSLISIGSSAFSSCSSLGSITLPNNLQTIGNSAFYYCKEISEIKLPDSISAIGDKAFQYCYQLSEVLLRAYW